MILAVATFLPVPRMWTHLETRSALNPDMSGSRYDLDQSYLIVLSRLTMTNSIHFLEFKSIQITWWPRDHKILTILTAVPGKTNWTLSKSPSMSVSRIFNFQPSDLISVEFFDQCNKTVFLTNSFCHGDSGFQLEVRAELFY